MLNIHNYEFILGNRCVLDDAALVKDIQQADIIIYQPIGEQFGRNSSASILAEARPGCQIIAVPYAFNYGFWPIVHVARSDVDINDEPAEINSATFINLDPVHDLLDQGYTVSRVLAMFESGEIDFDHASRFRYCQEYLADKEANCDVKVSGFIEDNYRQTKLFYYPSHPTLYLLEHMAMDIINLIGCQYNDHALREDAVWMPPSKLPFWQGSIDELGLAFPADDTAIDYYKKLIKDRFWNYAYE